MAVPKKRTPKSKRNKRRSHHGIRRLTLQSCPRCGQPVPGHTVCTNCGTYRGRDVIDVLQRLDKKKRKEKEKTLAQQAKQQTV